MLCYFCRGFRDSISFSMCIPIHLILGFLRFCAVYCGGLMLVFRRTVLLQSEAGGSTVFRKQVSNHNTTRRSNTENQGLYLQLRENLKFLPVSSL